MFSPPHPQQSHTHTPSPLCVARDPADSTALIKAREWPTQPGGKCSRKGHGSANPTKRDHPGLSPSIRQLLTQDIKVKKCLCLKPS